MLWIVTRAKHADPRPKSLGLVAASAINLGSPGLQKFLDDRLRHVYIVSMAELIGTFEQIVLLAVLGLGDAAYGRAVLREVEAALSRERAVTAGAVYTTLDRLEAKGLLSSRLDEGTPERGGRARRFYRLTAPGASALNHARATLDRLWQGKPWPLEIPA